MILVKIFLIKIISFPNQLFFGQNSGETPALVIFNKNFG